LPHQVGGVGFVGAADLALADLAEGLLERRGIGRDSRTGGPPINPGRPVGIDPADSDLVQKVAEIGRVGGIGTNPPEIADGQPAFWIEREQASANIAPSRGAGRPRVPFVLVPAFGAPGHFGRDVVRRE
jgi:hypothetical protein